MLSDTSFSSPIGTNFNATLRGWSNSVTQSPQVRNVVGSVWFKKFVVALGFMALGAGLFWMAQDYGWVSAGNTGTPRTITVVGTGTKLVTPAEATVSFSYVYDGVSRDAVVTEGEAGFSKIVSGLSKFSPKDVSKTTYQVLENPQTAVTGGKVERVSQFQYINAARITVSDPKMIEQVVSYLYDSGATNVTQVRFAPANQEKVETEVRGMAIEDAKMRAQGMVKATGARLGRVINIQEGASGTQQGSSVTNVTSQANGKAGADGSNIEMQSVVTVTYELR